MKRFAISCLLLVLPGGLCACPGLDLVKRNIPFGSSSSTVSGELSFSSDCHLLVRQLRYSRFAEQSQWWGSSNASVAVLLSPFAWDGSMDGTSEVKVEAVDNVEWDTLDVLELRAVNSSEVLAHVFLNEGAARRQLAAACSLTIAGKAVTYASCKNFNSEYTLFWSKINPTTKTVDFAYASKISTYKKWAGFGFGKEMIGSSVIVAKVDKAGSSTKQYYLTAEAESGLQSKGNIALSALKTEVSGGYLKTSFTVTPNAVVKLQKGLLPVVFAQGPLTSSGALVEHIAKGHPKILLT